MRVSEEFQAHLARGVTTLCRCWRLERRDGVTLGFTDHDCDLRFDGQLLRADSGLSASALQQATGLSVDNAEALGALSHGAVTEADILAGRFDAAEVTCWLVNWADVAQRACLFRGNLGEVQRSDGAFRAELRGLTDRLNQPQGRVIQHPCGAILGDADCGVDLADPGYRAEVTVTAVEESRHFRFDPLPGHDHAWFQRGVLRVLGGAAAGLSAPIKRDVSEAAARVIELWVPLAAAVAPGDPVVLLAGCDKRPETCRLKFNNLLNYRGFPDVPGEDWILSVPAASAGEAES